jgi:hypothetical protein
MQLEFGKIKCPRCSAGPRSLRVLGAIAKVTCPNGHTWFHHGKRSEPVADAAEARS